MEGRARETSLSARHDVDLNTYLTIKGLDNIAQYSILCRSSVCMCSYINEGVSFSMCFLK